MSRNVNRYSMIGNKKDVLVNLALFLFVIFMVLFCAEITFRLLLPQKLNADTTFESDRGRLAEYDELLGWRYRQNMVSSFQGNPVHLNNYGMRMQKDVSMEKSKKRIAIVGDSFMWGFNVEENDSFYAHVQEQFPEYEVLNFAVSGYGTDQYFLLLNHTVLAFEPDIVLIAAYTNDFENIGSSVQYGYQKPQFLLDGDSLVLRNVPVLYQEADAPNLFERGSSFLAHYSHLYAFFRPYLGNVIQSLMGGGLSESDPTLRLLEKNQTPEYEELVRLNQRLFCEIADLVEADLVVVSIPSQINVDESYFQEQLTKAGLSPERYDYKKQSKIMQEYSETCGFDVVDLQETFQHEDPEDVYNGHWTEKGEEMAATAVGKFLREHYTDVSEKGVK